MGIMFSRTIITAGFKFLALHAWLGVGKSCQQWSEPNSCCGCRSDLSVGTDIVGTVPHTPMFFPEVGPHSILLAHKYGTSLRGTGKKAIGTDILTHFNF